MVKAKTLGRRIFQKFRRVLKFIFQPEGKQDIDLKLKGVNVHQMWRVDRRISEKSRNVWVKAAVGQLMPSRE